MKNNDLSTELEEWVNDLSHLTTSTQKKITPHRISYVLLKDPYQNNHHGKIQIYLQRALKKGGYGKGRITHIDANTVLKYANEVDRSIIGELRLNHYNEISFIKKDHLFKKIILTHQLYINDALKIPLNLGPTIPASFEWQTNTHGLQQLKITSPQSFDDFYLADSLWYVSFEQNLIGQVETNLTIEIISSLLNAPDIPPSESREMNQIFAKKFPNEKQLQPKAYTIKKQKNINQIKPSIEFNFTDFDMSSSC
jgi:hypothetical protein